VNDFLPTTHPNELPPPRPQRGHPPGSPPLLEVEGLEVCYHVRSGTLKALADVTFDIKPGEILGIVGESGCGKSTLSLALLRLLPPNGEITSGRMLFKSRDLVGLSAEEMRELRGSELVMIFQDPLTSLNPTFTVGTQMIDIQKAHERRGGASGEALRRRAMEMLEQVGIPDVRDRIGDYPHQFSGGMRQRIMIASALMLEPALLIADEPTSALDVTLEAQIIELLKRLRETHGTAVIFISHDLGVVSQICDRVVVMYAGRAVEEADVVSIFEHPRHPYTQALLAAIPSHRRRGDPLATIPGRVPSLSALPPGCKFVERCPHARTMCNEHEPELKRADGGRVRCFIYDPASGYDDSRSSERSATRPEAVA
jgi:oligopeptide/dipeptide ABC transporter ATP-binding protein